PRTGPRTTRSGSSPPKRPSATAPTTSSWGGRSATRPIRRWLRKQCRRASGPCSRRIQPPRSHEPAPEGRLTMNANELIESYVTDVAVRLPRKQRNDVAFELRELLTEELQAKAEATGRDADAAMATELLQAFGRPVDVAARYRPTLTVIDPAD